MYYKTEDTYVALLTQVKILCATLDFYFHPQTSITDFEIANIHAISQVFPRTVIKGCLFHFSQSIWKRVVNEGLKEAYNNDDDLTVRNEFRELIVCRSFARTI